jgi:AcrR family transcriptional regulator
MRIRDVNKEKRVREEAIAMFVRDGFNGFSMGKLAKACDISVATLYIYFKDKDDLVITLAKEVSQKFHEYTLRDFSPDMHFRDGLKQQWANRMRWALECPVEMAFYESLRHSPHADSVTGETLAHFKKVMSEFTHNAIARGELKEMPLEIFWSVAYGTLYSLLRFHTEGKSVGGRKFKLQDKHLDEALEVVLKALRP